MRRVRIFALLLVALFVIAGCERQEPEFTPEDQLASEDRPQEEPTDGAGDESPAAPAGDGYTFVAVDIDFSDAPNEIPAGNVTFELVNEGAILHDVTMEDGPTVVEAQGGETATGSIALEPGTYTYYCSVPGHRAAGMEGELTVS